MRFLLFDRITSLDNDTGTIEGVKCITLADDAFDSALTHAPRYPTALVLESMVQVLAWAAITKLDFEVSVVLAGIEQADIDPLIAPGTSLRISGTMRNVNRNGSMGSVEAFDGARKVASIGRVIFGHVPGADADTMRARYRYFGGDA